MSADTEPDFRRPTDLADTHVAILGLGLMGGSLALALRGLCKALLAIDPDPVTRQFARQFRVVDYISANPAGIIPGADLIILAAPIRAILSTIEELPAYHAGNPVVLDVGSTKTGIMQALDALPSRFDPLGGHPMCGKETAGLGGADPVLYRGAAFAFTPLPRTSTRARSLAEQLARAVGARPLWLDPATHDGWVAATSHLPYLISTALSLATPDEAAPLVGPGFRSATRLAASNPKMMLDILTTNRAAILQALACFRGRLNALEELLAREESQALEGSLARAVTQQGALTGVSGGS